MPTATRTWGAVDIVKNSDKCREKAAVFGDIHEGQAPYALALKYKVTLLSHVIA